MSCLISPSPSPPSRVTTETDDEEHSSESGPSYLSPPPSPPPPSSTQPSASGTSSSHAALGFVRRTYTPGILSEPSFEIPETGYFHRVNPNYRPSVQPSPLHAAPRSLTPTEIVGSDGQPVSSSFRSTSPAQSDRTVQLSDSDQAPPKDLLERLGSLFNLRRGATAHRKNGTAGSDGQWEVDQQEGVVLVFMARTAVAKFASSSTDFLVGLLRYVWGSAPHFFATLVASLLAGYICKAYL